MRGSPMFSRLIDGNVCAVPGTTKKKATSVAFFCGEYIVIVGTTSRHVSASCLRGRDIDIQVESGNSNELRQVEQER